MSRQLMSHYLRIRKASFFIPAAFVVGFVAMAIYAHLDDNPLQLWKSTSGERTLASFQKTSAIPSNLGKHLALVNVSLEVPSQLPETAGESLTLKGHVTLTQPSASAARYEWMLPEGVSVVRGSLTGSLDPNAIGVAQSVEIEVAGFDQSEKRVITLIGQAESSGQTFGATDLISSRPQDSMEYLAPMMKDSVDQTAFERSL